MIIWLSSYPKNGNTWLRSLISAYYYTNDGFFLDEKQLQNIQQFPVKKYLETFDYNPKKPGDTVRLWVAAQDKINLAQEKLQTVIGDIATIFLPIVEGFGSMVGFLAENKVAAIALGSVLTGLAVSSVVSAVANIFSTLSQIPFGIGIPIAAAAVAGLFATIKVSLN